MDLQQHSCSAVALHELHSLLLPTRCTSSASKVGDATKTVAGVQHIPCSAAATGLIAAAVHLGQPLQHRANQQNRPCWPGVQTADSSAWPGEPQPWQAAQGTLTAPGTDVQGQAASEPFQVKLAACPATLEMALSLRLCSRALSHIKCPLHALARLLCSVQWQRNELHLCLLKGFAVFQSSCTGCISNIFAKCGDWHIWV